VLEKALCVLELFTERRSEWTVTEVSRELAMPFPTTHRIIRALEAHALLERTEGKSYRLGSGAIDLGRRARAALDLRLLLSPALLWLWRETDETTSVSIVDGRRLGSRCIDRIEGGYPFRLSPDLESVSPLYAGASGKALLANLGSDIVDHVLSAPLQACAANTPSSPTQLRNNLQRIRSRGWAFDDQELLDGAWGMAAAIFDPAGTLVASISFIAPTIRLSAELKRRGAQAVMDAAAMGGDALARRTPPT
jgi:DNA-binding IclR family transcriptional regulator